MDPRWLRNILLLGVAAICSAADLPKHAFVAYHDSWNEWPATSVQETSLAKLPEYINLVILAFAKPDAEYEGNLDIRGTGLEYQMPGSVLRDAVRNLKQSHPGTRVLLSVGGAAYRRWDRLTLPAIVGVVRDLGLDGVDIDFEPSAPECSSKADGRITCASDRAWDRIVEQFRLAFPRPLLVTASVWSVGAYGEGAYQHARPISPYTGVMLSLLRSTRAGELDLLSVDAYDAGPQFNPMEAFKAYRAVWRGPLALGVEIPTADGAGPFHSAVGAETLAREVAQDPLGGMMLYPLLALPAGNQPDRPTGSDLARAICRGLGLASCASTIP